MANKFANILGYLGLNGNTDPVTEAHLQAADDKIALLESAKSAAELKAEKAEADRVTAQTALDTATASLTTATQSLTKVQGELTTASTKLATLEDWRKKQAAADGRTEDDSNSLDAGDAEPKAAWETASAAAVASVKKRHGEK